MTIMENAGVAFDAMTPCCGIVVKRVKFERTSGKAEKVGKRGNQSREFVKCQEFGRNNGNNPQSMPISHTPHNSRVHNTHCRAPPMNLQTITTI